MIFCVGPADTLLYIINQFNTTTNNNHKFHTKLRGGSELGQLTV